jgi:hypothetical protein
MVFVTGGARPTPPANPEGLFRDLNRPVNGPKHLWAHQADLLRDYLNHLDDADLAIELPTGAGKTLVGMLIGEWRRRSLRQTVAYLCPTLQLARQAITDAAAAGITVVDLTGRNSQWDANDHLAYVQANAIAVAHYGALFNSNARLDDADVVIFDDAHAAAGSIADTWTVRFDADSLAYQQILQLLADGLPSSAAARLLTGERDMVARSLGYLVDPGVVFANLDALTRIIGTRASASRAKYGWQLIHNSLDACLVFVAVDELIIRPLLPPTSTHLAFTAPAQRLYLSATLGAGGELERAFGRPRITRMAVPEGWDQRGTGRRFFVFPELTEEFARAGRDVDAATARDAFVSDLMREAGRSLLLVPSYWALEQARGRLVPSGFTSFSASDVETSLSPFTTDPRAVLGLANRYDGIDLPDDHCRLIVLAGLPVGADPQEKFFTTLLGAKRVLQERTRTRFVQGAGRATRNANDLAVVVVLGQPLIAFAGDRNAQQGTHPEIRAELEIGLKNSSRRPAADVAAAIRQFLAQDPDWNEHVEPEIRTLREQYAATGDGADTAALAASAPYEIQAVDAAWRGEFADAVRWAERAIGALAGGVELRPYRALWNYLAAHWARRTSATDASYTAHADALLRTAIAAAAGTTWMPNRAAIAAAVSDGVQTASVDLIAAQGVVTCAQTFASARKLSQTAQVMVTDLSQRQSGAYERGLVTLGKLLGADSDKPPGAARADALWRWSNELWIAWEAKSEVLDEHDISAEDVRQANTHLRAAAADLDEDLPSGSRTFFVSGMSRVHDAAQALADDGLSFVSLVQVHDIAEKVAAAWMSLQGRLLSGAEPRALVDSVLAELTTAGALPSVVIQSLTARSF